MVITEYNDKFCNLVEKIQYTELYHLGTYTPQIFNKVLSGSIILGHCDGGHNELLLLFDNLPIEIKDLIDKSGKWIIINTTNQQYCISDSLLEIINLSGECYCYKVNRWLLTKDWISKYKDELPC